MKDYQLKSQEEAILYIQKLSKKLGATPSEKIFYKQSGMKLYPLQKLGFSNYGQLVNKARLAPNKFDRTKYSEKFLIDEFIKLIREKNRWPTKAEIDIKHFKDPNFPTSATYYKKFRLVKGMAEKILDSVIDKNDNNDVIEICKNVLNEYENKSDNEFSSSERGYVYIFKKGKQPEYKIGIAKDILKRGKQLATSSPKDYLLIYSIEAKISPGAVERFLHDRFKNKKINREWFNLSSSDIKWIKNWDGNVLLEN